MAVWTILPAMRTLLALIFLVSGCSCCGPGLPPQTNCAPLAQRCRDGRPEVCSSTRRWHSVGDVVCSRGCEMTLDGYAVCAPEGAL